MYLRGDSSWDEESELIKEWASGLKKPLPIPRGT